MGVVYRASQERSEVAVKLLRRSSRFSSETKRFLNEAAIGGRLRHPHLVQVFEVGSLEDDLEYSHYLVMEYVSGKSLKELSAKREQLSIARIVRIFAEICEGLRAIHQENIVHRDLKPSNILLTQDGTVKISDFGVIKMDADTHLTQTGTILGTLAYMSPEQCQDSSRVDLRSDIYSLGIMLFEMFAGRLPFEGPTEFNFIYQHFMAPVPQLQDFAPDIPPRIYLMVERMLHKDPARRYQSASEVAQELSAISEEISGVFVSRSDYEDAEKPVQIRPTGKTSRRPRSGKKTKKLGKTKRETPEDPFSGHH